MSGVAESLLDDNGEVVVALADGWTLRSGIYNKTDPHAFTSGEYVRLCKSNGDEYAYWDQEEWRTDPALVMGAIINAAAGLRLSEPPSREHDWQPVMAEQCATCGELLTGMYPMDVNEGKKWADPCPGRKADDGD